MDTKVAVIGAGPAGLAAALTLSRSMMKTVVFNSATAPRNASSPFVAALPGFDRSAPGTVRDAVRRDIQSYDYVSFEDETIASLCQGPDGFELQKSDGSSMTAEFVLLATGMVDILPPLEGLNALWGTSIINCPFCHGIEWQNKRWGIYGHRPEVVDAAAIYRHWTPDLVYFIDPDIDMSEERGEAVSRTGAAVQEGLPVKVHSQNGKLAHVEMADGKSIELDCLLVFPYQKQTEFVADLNVSLTDAGYVNVDDGFRTSLTGVYAAGDLVYPGHQNTPTAFHMGNMAAATIVMDYCFRQ